MASVLSLGRTMAEKTRINAEDNPVTKQIRVSMLFAQAARAVAFTQNKTIAELLDEITLQQLIDLADARIPNWRDLGK